MARDFNGSTDRIDWAPPTFGTGQPMSISVWVWRDTRGVDYFLVMHRSGNTDFGIIFFDSNNSGSGLGLTVTVNFDGASDLFRPAVFATVSTGVWEHLAMTWDGSNDPTNIHIYRDGSEVSYNGSPVTGVGSQFTPDGSWSAGGRIFDDLRNLDGREMFLGVWDRVLTAGERAALAKGFSPEFFKEGLVFFPKDGMTKDTPHDAMTGTTASLDGTSVIENSRIIRPAPVGVTSRSFDYERPHRMRVYA